MAMNRKEQAEFDRMKAELASMRSLAGFSPVPVAPMEPPSPPHRDRLMVGWHTNVKSDRVFESNPPRDLVSQGCSDGTNHSTYRTDKVSTQGPGVFYRTKRDALLALRNSVLARAAHALGWIDGLIAQDARDEGQKAG